MATVDTRRVYRSGPPDVNLEPIERTYSLAPMQQGMLYHCLVSPRSGAYIEQMVGNLREELDPAVFVRAWQTVVDRHPAFRSVFRWDAAGEPRQEVLRHCSIPMAQADFRGLSASEADARIEEDLVEDRRRGFDLAEGPAVRLALYRLANSEYRVVWTFHHALLDGYTYRSSSKRSSIAMPRCGKEGRSKGNRDDRSANILHGSSANAKRRRRRRKPSGLSDCVGSRRRRRSSGKRIWGRRATN